MAANKAKMPPASTDEQFKFLISCIRYSNNGKVDFTEVANECNIVSKGAAAKRYERMMKQHGLHQSAGSSRDVPTSPVAKEPKSAKGPTASKKRKVAAMDGAADMAHDDDEGHCRDIKTESCTIVKEEGCIVVKDEPEAIEELGSMPAEIMPYQNVQTGEHVSLTTDNEIFNDFLSPTVFEPQDGSAKGDDFLSPTAFEPQNESAKAGYNGTYESDPYAGMGAADGAMLHGSILID